MGQRTAGPPFVGRTEEMAVLERALSSVPDEGAATFLIGGDAGVGKTRLVDEFCGRARSQGWLVAAGYCSPVDGPSRPYGPLVGVLRELGKQVSADALAPMCRALGLGMAVVDGEPSDHGPTPTSDLAKTRLLDTILAGVAGLAQHAPLLLAFEDLHWADSATIDLIDSLTRNLGRAPVMLLVTYRADELHALHPARAQLLELGRHGRVAELPLAGLDREGIAAMLAGILGHEPDWVLADAVFSRSEGNPFFAEELAAARDTRVLPVHLQDVIMLRVGGLSEEAQHVLGVIAVVGASADHRLLAAVCEPAIAALDSVMAETVDRRLLTLDATGSRYQFRHSLIREAVYGSLLPGMRARLHRQIAACLSARPDFLPSGLGHADVELAGHWWAAAEWAKALPALLRAAGAAESVFAFAQADAHLERALLAWDRISDPTERAGIERIDLLERAANAAYFGASADRASKIARAAVDEINPTAEPRRAALAFARLGRNLAAVDTHASFEALQQACALLADDPPSVERARVFAEQARLLMMLSHSNESAELCRQAIATAKAANAREEEGHATNTLGCCLANLGRPTEGIALIRTALEIAEELESPDDLNRAYNNLSATLFNAGRLQEAAAIVFDARAIGHEIGGIRLEGAALNSAEALINLGQWEQAETLMFERGPMPGVCVNNYEMLQGLMALRRGRFEQAHQALTAADQMTAGQNDVQTRGVYHMLQAQLALEERRHHDAAEEIDQALSLAAASDDEFFGVEMRAIALRGLADAHEDVQARGPGERKNTEKARLRAAELVEGAERLVSAAGERGAESAPQPRAFALQCRAEESRLDGSDAALWQPATTAWDELSMPYHASYCRWRQAAALLATRSGRPEVSELLGQAWRASDNMGATELRRKIEQLAQRARISLSTDAAPAVGDASPVASDLGLTSREVEVLGQLALGKTDAQIAQQLFISKKTVSVHVSNLLRKLDVSNRFEAGEIGQQVGLGSP